MTKRQVVIDAMRFRNVPYVPWAWHMTVDCAAKVQKHLGKADLSDFLDTHFCNVGADIRPAQTIDSDHFRDIYGVVWDVSVDKDIGTPCDYPIRQKADLAGYKWPKIVDDGWRSDIVQNLAAGKDLFRRYNLGFSLFERAWTMMGMEHLLMAMVNDPQFVEELLDAIVEHNLQQIRAALDFDIDCVHFGDDYGMQVGLITGLPHWRRFIKPRLERMFQPVRDAGRFVSMHSCGAVDVLFDDLVEIGLNCFNPFQPEVMDVFGLMKQYHGRLAFHGGMSIQKVLPFGTVAEVRDMTRRLLEAGRGGGYVFSPSHQVPRDVPPENLVAMMEEVKAQKGWPGDGAC